jgi:ribulose 1,5-bisphosphate synthetase/thiazole synthase
MKRPLTVLCLGLISIELGYSPLFAASDTKSAEKIVACDIFIAGGGLSGTATAYEGLLAGKRVCMTEITDWIGGQITSQGVSAWLFRISAKN